MTDGKMHLSAGVGLVHMKLEMCRDRGGEAIKSRDREGKERDRERERESERVSERDKDSWREGTYSYYSWW